MSMITLALAVIFGAMGLGLSVAGGWLVMLGGSPYYLLAGLCNLVVAMLLAKRRPSAAPLYALYLSATLAWSLYESGLEAWALLPRIALPVAFGLLLIPPFVARAMNLSSRGRVSVACAMALCVAAFVVSLAPTLFHPAAADARFVSNGERSFRWDRWGGNDYGQRHAPIDQINTGNVAGLTEAWTFQTGHGMFQGKPALGTTFEATPLQIGNQLVFCTPFNVVISVDGDSGRELWRFDPHIDRSAPISFVCRGLAYHASPGSALCSQRVLSGTLDNRLIAIDANTGRLCAGFGKGGEVDLTNGLQKILPGYRTVTSPPTIINGAAVVGAYVLDGQSVKEPSGVVRAYDVETGALLWAWDPLSSSAVAPGQPYVGNSPNFWSVASADPQLNLVYLPLGGGTPDFFAGKRTPERDRFGSSIVALDARTGNVRWTFQTVHHDIWDYDAGSQPILFNFRKDGTDIPALAAPTKRGEIFILDRRTGRPLVPVVERPVPHKGAPGEWPSPTQPFVSGFPSFAPSRLREADMWGVTPFDQLWCRIAFHRARYDGPFTPPSIQGSIVQTGSLGGFNWGSMSIDPERGLLIGNFNALPYILRLIPRQQANAQEIRAARSAPGVHIKFENGQVLFAQAGLPYAASMGAFLSPLGIPCSQPPWGQIGAIDIASKKVRWVRPLGTTRDIAPLGITLPMGPPNIGGSITTRGGLTFVGAAADDYVRAFDSSSGAELWRQRLPAGGQAVPMTYVSPRTGRQYVVIAAGGHASLGTRAGDYLIAFALPSQR